MDTAFLNPSLCDMASSQGIAEPLIICCQQGDWHNQTKDTSFLSKDLGAFLKHLINEAIRISTVCTTQGPRSSLEVAALGEVVVICV